ncbi:MAG: S41 family peptidase [Rikenellaceae bacterium]
MKIKSFLALALTSIGVNLAAQEVSPEWLRNSRISPDGEQICFTYKGDIYTVAVDGGQAKQITTNPAYDTKPIWSPNGEQIMFSSNREGSQDIYIVDSKGGAPKRLTTHSGSETPIAFLDDQRVLFGANIMPSASDAQFPSSIFSQVYEVSTQGGRAKLFSSMPMESIDIAADGSTLLYVDKKGYEDPYRKHHTSSIARDIWSAKLSDGRVESYVKLSDFEGEDRDPIFSAQDGQIFYTSEQDGSFNVYKMDLSSKKSKQITFHKDHPVRSLSRSTDDLLAYSYNGDMYTLNAAKSGAEPTKVDIKIIRDQLEKSEIQQTLRSGAHQMSLSPNGKEIAFILRGDVYVTSVDYATTKQITNSADQERNVDFSPDGRSVIYASERNGIWQIYQTSIARDDQTALTYATEIKEERVTDSAIASFLPQYSPDGKEVAFLEDRTTLRVINLKSKKVRTVRDKRFEYSYTDGDQWFTWSPDSKWILSGYIGEGGWNNGDVALINADGSGEIHNLTQSGYTDTNAKWVLGGKAMIWQSDRAGYRSHGSWGSEYDSYIMFFDLEAYEKFRMNKEELELLAAADNDKKSKKEKKEEAKEDSDSTKIKKVEPLELDIENTKDRIIRLTNNSSRMADALLTADGEKLYYLTRFESGFELWVNDLKKRETKLLIKNSGAGELISGSKPTEIFMSSGGQLKKIDVGSNRISTIPFESQFTYRPKQEREYIFNHIWQQVSDKFYVEDIHGVPWEMYRECYEAKLDDIDNNTDFAELLSELLGELNGSHTGARHYAPNSAQPTATLGLFFDERYQGDGLKIAEIVKGSPLNIIKSEVQEGDVITKIDGVEITADMDYFPLLAGKANKPIILTVKKSGKGKEFEQSVKPISNMSTLLYKRWIERRAEIVDSLSNGRLGYIHIKGMNSESYREMYSTLLGKLRNKEAVIVDTRHNGGGWLHDDVVTLLSGKKYQDFVAHGQYIGSDPFNKWNKPSCMLICEDNYSNAHGTPWVYKELGIGKLIGAPVPGTMTAVWWETQIDSSIVFGIPQVGCRDNRGNFMENVELQPDILVYNEPEKSLNGVDTQLEAAVKHMLEVVDGLGRPESDSVGRR